MRIGEAAAQTNLTVKAIRHYEAVGLLGEVDRSGAYRDLTDADVNRLRLIAHCRDLGFSLPEIREVVSLVSEAAPACPDAEAMLEVVRRRQARVEAELSDLLRRRDRLAEQAAYLERRAAS